MSYHGLNGLVPVGAVIPVASALAWALPAGNTIKNGFALCNGQNYPSGSHSSFGAGAMPNLSDSRFMQGSTTTGTTGGANSTNFAHTHGVTSNVAVSDHTSHTHTVTSNVAVSDHTSHTHTVTSSVVVGDHTTHTHGVTSNVTVGNHSSHTHNMAHAHQVWGEVNWYTNMYSASAPLPSQANLNSGTMTTLTTAVILNGTGTGNNAYVRGSSAKAGYSAGPVNASSTLLTDTGATTDSAHAVTNNAVTSVAGGPTVHAVTNNQVTTNGPGAALSHGVTNNAVTSTTGGPTTHSVTNNAVTSGSGLTTTDTRPLYLNVVFVMRVA